MATTIDSTALFFGAPASLTVGGDEIGASLTAPKVDVQVTQYAPDFQGAGGPISGAVFNTKIKATLTCDVNEITAAKLAWSLPGSASVAGTGTPSAGADAFATTLDANTAIGDTLLPVTATTDATPTTVAAGMFLKIGTGTGAEIRKVKAIVTGAAVEVTEALQLVHTSGDAVVRLVDADTTVTTWRIGRVASTEFKTVVVDGVGVDGRHLIVTINHALSDGHLTVELSDSAVAGSTLVFTGYYDGADPQLAPFQIEVG